MPWHENNYRGFFCNFCILYLNEEAFNRNSERVQRCTYSRTYYLQITDHTREKACILVLEKFEREREREREREGGKERERERKRDLIC